MGTQDIISARTFHSRRVKIKRERGLDRVAKGGATLED